MRCYWARADLFVPRMVTLAGYTVLFGHLVGSGFVKGEEHTPT